MVRVAVIPNEAVPTAEDLSAEGLNAAPRNAGDLNVAIRSAVIPNARVADAVNRNVPNAAIQIAVRDAIRVARNAVRHVAVIRVVTLATLV